MAFLDESHEEAAREEREREEARQREVAQAKALAKAARSAAIFKFACVGVTILAITAVFAMIDARKSRDEADRQIINLAKRSIATGEAMNAEDDHLGALVWYADAIRLAEKDPAIQSNTKTFSEANSITPSSFGTAQHQRADRFRPSHAKRQQGRYRHEQGQQFDPPG